MDHKEAMKAGFKPLTEVETDVRYYFTKETGNWLQGILMARHERPGGKEGEHFYEIKLTRPCDTVVARGFDEDSGDSYEIEDGEDSVASIGDIVRLDETAGLKKPLMNALAQKGQQEIYVECKRKVQSKKSKRSFWRMEVFARPHEG